MHDNSCNCMHTVAYNYANVLFAYFTDGFVFVFVLSLECFLNTA